MPVTVGQRAQRSLMLTSDHVRTFASLTGDYNPLHFDADFAARTKFHGLVVQGGLTTGDIVLEGEAWCYTLQADSEPPP